MQSRPVLVPAWGRPPGYSDAMISRPDSYPLVTAGVVGWDDNKIFQGGFLVQYEQALRNVVTIVEAAGGRIEDIVRLTFHVVVEDNAEYFRRPDGQRELGEIYRSVMGKHFPAMGVIGAYWLVAKAAQVEVFAEAFIPRNRLMLSDEAAQESFGML